MKIYTKTGDNGTTSLFGGERVAKNHSRVEAYGTIDELNSHIGLIISKSHDKESNNFLVEIQSQLFTIGSHLATTSDKVKIPELENNFLAKIEKNIDNINEIVPPMRNFILPGGNELISSTHIARCVCRRAERRCIEVDDFNTKPIVLKILNRLSDYLFVLARYYHHTNKIKEQAWLTP